MQDEVAKNRMDIVVLASSRRPGGHCVAGVEVGAPQTRWVRPVGNRSGDQIWPSERRYSDGREISVLDIAQVRLSAPRPTQIQPENWTIGPTPAWEQIGSAAAADLRTYLRSGADLWPNGLSSTYGLNNRITPEAAANVGESLTLIEVSEYEIEAYTNAYSGKRKVRASFSWAGAEYVLDVTDPPVEDAYLARGNGRYEARPAFLTISLTSPFNGHCYKLVAAVIEKDAT